MTTTYYDIAIIGAGPGGEVAAIRAAQLGLKTAMIEKREHLGGTCLNVGCIPTKCLLESAKFFQKLKKASELGISINNYEYNWSKILERKENIVDKQRKGLKFLMKKNKVTCYTGHGFIKDKNSILINKDQPSEKLIECKHILIATGSKVSLLPFTVPDADYIHTSDSIMDIEHMPKSLAIIGGGVVGLEFACLFNSFGCEVTVIELASQLIPYEDREVSKELLRILKKQGIHFKLDSKISALNVKNKKCVVTIEKNETLNFEKVLVSIGREPVTDQLGLEELGIAKDKKFILTNEHYQTNIDNIFAIGDVINTPALAHTASAEAIHAVEIIAGLTPPRIDYEANPSAMYTFPEVASIGHTEQKLLEKNVDFKIVKFPFSPLAKAKIENATDGFIKILYGSKHKEILGVHIIGDKATELISEFALGKILETTLDEIGHTIHPHPTISETIMEAAHSGLGGAIHL